MTRMTPLQTAGESLIDQLLSWPEILGLFVLLFAAWVVWKRTRDSSDPRGNLAFGTDTGNVSVLISGAYWVALLVVVAAFFLEPVIMEFPLLAVLLVGLVGLAYWMEKREAMG